MDEIKKKIQDCSNQRDELLRENKELQQEITRLAHIQDRSQIELEEIRGKIASLEGKSGLGNTIADLKHQMDKLKKSAEAAEKDLDHCFDRSENVENAIEALEKKINKFEEENEAKKLEKKNLIEWGRENKINPVVRVEGAVQPGTFIQGAQSELMVKNLIRHVKIAEAQEGDTGIVQMQVTNF